LFYLRSPFNSRSIKDSLADGKIWGKADMTKPREHLPKNGGDQSAKIAKLYQANNIKRGAR